MRSDRQKQVRFARAVLGVAVATAVAALATSPAHAAGSGRTETRSFGPTPGIADYTLPTTAATMADVRRIIRADVANNQGYTGKGVGIALIDTGIVPVEGLTSGNIANGPDLSFESQVASLTRRDTYGHGTHMAGIIAGRDSVGGAFKGIAPDAKLLSLKVGAANGAVDVTQMMAAIDWVVAHRNDDPANPIKVLNLSYGTDSTLGWSSNPLTYAVQNARRAGIVVVVAAGNTGAKVISPAFDPFVFTVGATDMRGTTNPTDDIPATFSSQGDDYRTPDVMAPGTSIVALRDPGSYADIAYPTARVGDRFFKGSGTSQAAAVVSGAAAIYLQKYPTASPDSVKCSLNTYASPLAAGSDPKQVNLEKALASAPVGCTVSGTTSTGTGTIQAARGTSMVTLNGSTLTGERDIFGPLSSSAWAAASAARTSWQGGNWMGRPWTGTGWTTATAGQQNWSGRSWAGTSWSGRAWSDLAWSGASWTGRAWSNTSFNGATWAGTSWSGVTWLSGGNGSWMY